MSEHISEARMHEALDGALSAAETAALDAHFDTCAACRDGYARLSEVVGALHALPRGARPPESTWTSIRSRIEGVDRDDGGEGVTVLELPTGRPSPTDDEASRRSRVSLGARSVRVSVAQLAAAAAVVAFVSAGVMRLAMEGGARPAETAEIVREEPGGAAARAVSLQPAAYGETIERLEQILAEGRDVLAPETLVTIEESLATVDSAIDEIETALAEDPSSDLLQRLLSSHQSRKLGVLQRAVGAMQSTT